MSLINPQRRRGVILNENDLQGLESFSRTSEERKRDSIWWEIERAQRNREESGYPNNFLISRPIAGRPEDMNDQSALA